MKILVVSSQALFTETRFGGSKRIYYLAKELEKWAEVHVLCLDGNREWPGHTPFPDEFRHQLFIPVDPPQPWWKSFSFPVGIKKLLARNHETIDSFLGNHRFDATLLVYPFSLCFLEKEWRLRMGRLVYMEDDLLLEYYRKNTAQGSFLTRILNGLRLRQARTFFNRKLAEVSSLICISREEQEIVVAQFPSLPTRLLKYGIPLEDYPFLTEPAEKLAFGFIGNYRNVPNLDALNWLVDDIFPFLSAKIPGAKLILAGENIPEVVKNRFATNPAVEIWGSVEDLSRFYGTIAIFLNPLREGRGLKTKVIEAAAFGRPVVSTPLGAEGLEEMQLNLSATKEEFLDAIVSLADPVEYRRVSHYNRGRVESDFSLSKLGRDLLGILDHSTLKKP